jgi:hypothetical protein
MPPSVTSRRFNTQGVCVPERHYMVDLSSRLATVVRDYIDPGDYFTINRPRQYGKSTLLAALRRGLAATHVLVRISFEGREEYFTSARKLAEAMRRTLETQLRQAGADTAALAEPIDADYPMDDLGNRITACCASAPRPVVLLIDEVDRATDYAVFAAFLGLLRDKYLERNAEGTATFQSVILAGVHDVKNLKKKIRPESEHSYNSPWNIAVDFTIDLSFDAADIETMLAQYEADHATGMDLAAVAGRLHFYTNGYPFLVSRLCEIVHQQGLPWTADGVDQAEAALVKEENTLFDDLVKNLDRNPDYADLVRSILLWDATVTFTRSNPAIDLGAIYGVLTDAGGRIGVANIIFETVIYDYFSSLKEVDELARLPQGDKTSFVSDGRLDLDAVLHGFSQFMATEYRDRDSGFIEHNARLLFLAYLRPIINGQGNYAVEPETRAGQRMDIVVYFGPVHHIIELKIWRGPAREAQALDQLAAYLKAQHQTEGWLLSFADQTHTPRRQQTIDHAGVTIYEYVVAFRDDRAPSPKPS